LKWEITYYDRERMAPGYWFVAPYGQISPEHPTQKYQQYQVGPYIYDDNGVGLGPPKTPVNMQLTSRATGLDLGWIALVR
jgi:hypothetical protein